MHQYQRVCSESFQNLEEALSAAVISTSRSDVEVGCFLSGGVDSSIVTAIHSSRQSCKAFTIGISDDEQSDELGSAKRIAESIGLEHYHLSIGSSQIVESIQSAISSFDTPILDASIIPTYIVSELASRHVKVVLGGDGAEELFLGYNRHRPLMMSRFILKLVQISSRVDTDVLNLLGWKFGIQKLGDKIIKLKKLTRGKSLSERYFLSLSQANIENIPKQLGLQDLRNLEYDFYLSQNILRKTDVLSMAHGLESRAPYLDTTFTNWVERNYSQEYLLSKPRKKDLYALRRKLLPEMVDLDTVKRGFGLPISDYIRSNKIEDFKDVLHSKTSYVTDVKNFEKLNPYDLWSIYVMKKWILVKS
jgi:asparagine synthase (glutamine-hydrolysing)